MAEEFAVVVPWFNEEQRDLFLGAWNIQKVPDWLLMMQDINRDGCGVMKNRGVAQAVSQGAETVVILDDDCFPDPENPQPLYAHALAHIAALEVQEVELFEEVTSPPSRGTPYGGLTVKMPVAASMGFWTGIGDYCGIRQLAFAGAPMEFKRETVFGRYFPLCGMNLAFRPADWLPWSQFIDVPRFDDIWMGWLWQYRANELRYCFNLKGPLVRHARQSNAWNNLRVEAEYVEASDELWKKIALAPTGLDYDEMSQLLPPHRGGTDR